MPTGSYTIDPNNASEPLDTRYVADMPAELRALKGKVNGLGTGGGGTGGGGGTWDGFADITAYGAVGDFVSGPGGTGAGTSNDSAIMAAIATNKPLYIPAGNFYVAYWTTRYAFSRATVLGSSLGHIWGDTSRGKQILGNTLNVGVANTHEIDYAGGIKWAAGSAFNGTRTWLGHHNWMITQPDNGPMQAQLYPGYGGKGYFGTTAHCVSPDKLVADLAPFDMTQIRPGNHVGWAGAVYKVASVIDGTTITVTKFDGSSPAFVTDTTPKAFYMSYECAMFTANVSGTTVTRISGDALPYGFGGDHMYAIINGTRYSVAQGPESTGNPSTITLTSSPGTLTNASVEFYRIHGPWAYVTLFRLQGLGGGVETNGGMAFTIKNQLRVFNGGDPNDPLTGDVKVNGKRVILGQSDGGSDDELLEVGANYITLGGRFGSNRNFVEIDSLGPTIAPFIKAEGVGSNMNLALAGKGSGGVQLGVKANTIIAYDAPTGFAAVIASRGADPNPDLGFDLKGNGAFRFTAGTYGRVVGEIVAAANSTGYVQHVSGVDAAHINTAGSATNIDLQLQPKGTGKTIVGSQLVANSGSWVSMSFSLLNGWTDATWGISARYRLDVGSRVVRLSGQISGGANGSKIYELPAEYRPSRTVVLSTVGSGVTAAAVQILVDGSVHGFGYGSPVTQVVLDGLTFPID